jgi:hypothetical protein
MTLFLLLLIAAIGSVAAATYLALALSRRRL